LKKKTLIFFLFAFISVILQVNEITHSKERKVPSYYCYCGRSRPPPSVMMAGALPDPRARALPPSPELLGRKGRGQAGSTLLLSPLLLLLMLLLLLLLALLLPGTAGAFSSPCCCCWRWRC
jgi:hypothetical protein